MHGLSEFEFGCDHSLIIDKWEENLKGGSKGFGTTDYRASGATGRSMLRPYEPGHLRQALSAGKTVREKLSEARGS